VYGRHSNPFIFGVTEDVPLSKLKELFLAICLGEQQSNSVYGIDNIQIVLVGHSVKSDMMIIEKTVPRLWQITPIAAVIDLSILYGWLKLGTVLEHLKIGDSRHRWLHCGGNDANWTLRAVLLSAVNYFESDTEGNMINQERAEKIRQIVLGNIPKKTRKRS
jgi:hypothetical protein